MQTGNPIGTLQHINTIIQTLTANAAGIGITLGSLMLVVYAIYLMFHRDTSPQGRLQRMDDIKRVLLSAAIIAGAGIMIQVVTGLVKL